ncbi:MAG: hypothetical protein IJ666_07000 [Ruminococcus sp.]|nr:hypothetical protein [Ruminococcus sp.]
MKHKGVIIELTALLDVILIMLFWVMMNLQQQNEQNISDIENQYNSQIDELNTLHEQEVSDMENQYNSQIDELNTMHESEISEMRENYEQQIENIEIIAENSSSWQYYQALENYSGDMVLTLNLQYDASGRTGKLSLNDKNSEISHTTLNSHEREDEDAKKVERFIASNLNLDSGEIILCAFVYNGSRATSSDVDNVKQAINSIRGNYSNFYCTYVNLNK